MAGIVDAIRRKAGKVRDAVRNRSARLPSDERRSDPEPCGCGPAQGDYPAIQGVLAGEKAAIGAAEAAACQ